MAFEASMDQFGNPEAVNALGVGLHVTGEDLDQVAGVDAESTLIQQLASQVDFEAATTAQNACFSRRSERQLHLLSGRRVGWKAFGITGLPCMRIAAKAISAWPPGKFQADFLQTGNIMAFEAQMDQYGNPENVNAMGVGVHVPGEDLDQGAGVDAESMLIQQLASQVDFEAPMGQNGNFEAVNASGVGLQVAGEEPNHFEGEDAEATLIQQLAS
eukprot:CAMPEP_0172940366 /NCGR_PEP_ID=MMETSP1075-20121228/223998_1 /TAXON_ID=2916 /ORGANISM="Ceratium fusus, Strain PA161109" /LENGTH=214 /DNA_ID=CAMNT_0013801763 /DNA_START=245 /DNA_END=887 /DNA_ORIENTATION=-